jgi:transcriptional regulator with XRE-family HTH domain
MALKTVKQYSEEIAERAKNERQHAKLTQAQLSEHAGIPLSTYKRFEQRGLVSFEGLIKVAIALRLENSLDALFAPRANETEYTSLEDVEKALGSDAKRPRRRHPNP